MQKDQIQSTAKKIESNIKLNRISQVIEDLKNGKPIILMDNEDRENEGDLVIGAEFMTPELCTLFIKKTTGIVCVSMEEKRAIDLNLPKAIQKMRILTVFRLQSHVII